MKKNNRGSFDCLYCGWNYAPTDRVEEDDDDEVERPRRFIASVDIPQTPKTTEKPVARRRGAMNTGSAFDYGSRKQYLSRLSLIEEDILTDEHGREYWIKDNYSTGNSEHVPVPTRYKNEAKRLNRY